MLEQNKIYLGDCLEVMKDIESKSINCIIADLPYGTTNRNKWDIVIPFKSMWEQYERIIKDNGAILLFGDEPFTSELILSNRKLFKQRITWDKDRGSGFLNAHKMLMKQTEDICLFYKKPPIYNPQMTDAKPKNIRPISKEGYTSLNYGGHTTKPDKDYNPKLRYPTNLIKFSSMTGECNNVNRLHTTQKPIELYKWLMETYSQKGDLILDNCCGSGTIKVAQSINRNFIGIEKDEHIYNIANNRNIS